MIEFKFRRGQDLRPFNTAWWAPTQKQWAPILLKLQGPYWKREVDPTYQRPWARLSPAYKKWKDRKYPNQPILRATGKMQDTAKIKPQGQGFEVKTTDYGAYHQFGTTKMPARPWMGIPDDSLKAIVPIAWKNILSRKR
jgi:phage gpG-like protein